MEKNRLTTIRPRLHKTVYRCLRQLLAWPLGRSYHYTATPYTPAEQPFLLLCNHHLAIDAALVAIGLKTPLYFVVNEPQTPPGYLAKLLIWGLKPILRRANQTEADIQGEILTALQRGDNVALFIEGECSFTGITGPLPPSVGNLVKLAKVPLLTYRLDGGYLTQPPWAKNRRHGGMAGRVVNEYTPPLLDALSPSQINILIQADLYSSANEEQGVPPRPYRGKNLAEHLETALYLCPECGGINLLKSRGDFLFCQKCGLRLRFTPDGVLVGEDGAAFPYPTVQAWMQWQKAQLQLAAKDWPNHPKQPLATDHGQTLYCYDGGKKRSLGIGQTILYGDKLVFLPQTRQKQVFYYAQIDRIHLRKADLLNFSLLDGRCFELRSDHPRSALKYLEIYEASR
ncbi:MAG: 1-acyl-sn-glycerol-3-phosphate acyltransferase [Clostridiales bacterium]